MVAFAIADPDDVPLVRRETCLGSPLALRDP